MVFDVVQVTYVQHMLTLSQNSTIIRQTADLAPFTVATLFFTAAPGGDNHIARMAAADKDLDAVPGVNASPDAATKGFIFQQTMYRIKVCLSHEQNGLARYQPHVCSSDVLMPWVVAVPGPRALIAVLHWRPWHEVCCHYVHLPSLRPSFVP